ncbi:competence type IV pilus assembly protein ComGB [Guptibacillus algicola]|uniref:competence type IV pilus assembly protein ComGB n=1 Tax=Guptibacillus algicola TaxID=225844 RepID=UPI001CD36006|nr:competence type IV pilus assembly protein ComGB [Alkalihalobacillus algicola]MCA0986009.1 type II secretion system F family protein [Alkalihalobacillus algicola]
MRRSKWKLNQKADFLFRIGRMLVEGYTLGNALEVYSIYQKDHIRTNIQYMIMQLKEGNPFHEVLSEFQFPDDILSYLCMSEQRDFAFGVVASGELMKKRSEWRKRLRSTLAYPIILFWMTAVMLFIVGKYLLPKFNTLYQSLDVPLPIVSRLFMTFIQFTPVFLILLVLTLLLGYIYFVMKQRQSSAVTKLQLYCKFPFAKLFVPKYITHHLALHLGLLLHSGLSISDAFELIKKQSHFVLFQEEAHRVSVSLMKGEKLEGLFENKCLYVEELREIFMHGQASGNLGKELILYGEVMGERFEELVKKGFLVLQPISFVGVGLVVMLMFMSILLPMFYYLQSI